MLMTLYYPKLLL